MSNRPAFGILLALTLGLSALVAAELRREDGASGAPAVPQPTVRSDPAPPVDHTDRLVDAILARPLFSRSRRPAAQSSPDAGVPAGLPRLSGILVGPHRKTVIFAGAAERKAIAAGEGSRVGDYVVEAIAPDRVTLRGRDGEKVLHLAYGAQTAAPSAPLTAGAAGETDRPAIHAPGQPF